MKDILKPLFITLLALTATVQGGDRPQIGFAFPAGGQQGDSFEVLIGGQYLESSTNVFVSGEGVQARIEKYSVKYDPKQIRRIFRNMENSEAALEDKEGKERTKLQQRIDRCVQQLHMADLPEGMDPMDKNAVQKHYRYDQKEQFNPQISERLLITVTIDEKAPPGERELRVYTPAGLSNPLYFQVGTLTEVRETEPNDDHMGPGLQEVQVPSIINGQIRPGDIDHFRFSAYKGDSIVVDVGARRIIPYLADAVPGWFQAVVALYDEDGNEVAYQDDYKFHPDPVLFFDVPQQGVYTLSIRDSIYRGREDFIYRIAIGELPFITSIFPLGAQQGRDVDIALTGKNLPKKRLTGKIPAEGPAVRHVSVNQADYRSNPMPFAIGEMKERFEEEPNNAAEEAQPIHQPLIINGRIQHPGDVDVFSFHGSQGDSVSIEVTARRLNSPLDSVVVLKGPDLKEIARNDDNVNKNKTHLHLGAGLITHHADSYLLHELPATGPYFVEIGDAQSKGGHDYGYRLRVSPANPDFMLRMEPSGLQISPGGTAAFSVRASRQDGFVGSITLESANLPPGFSMSKAIIQPGTDTTRFTITAPKEISGRVVSPEITGMGMINGSPVQRTAVPVDDQMQAFLYRHLVPAHELVLAPVLKTPPLIFEARVPKSGFIELPIGKECRINFKGKFYSEQKGAALLLDNPPEGITLKKGWISRNKRTAALGDAQQRSGSDDASGSILVEINETLKPGDSFSLVVIAEVKQGADKIRCPAPAIPVKIVRGE